MNWANPAYFVAFAALTGVATAALACRRGRRVLPWLAFGTVAWFIAIPWLYLTKSRLPEGEKPSSGMVSLALVALCGSALLVRVDFSSREAMLPTCDSYLGVTDVRDFISRSPEGKAFAPELKTLTGIKEVSRSATELNCIGTVHMDTAAPVQFAYRFVLKDGQRIIEAHWQ